jgi:RNA polymerase sigma factor (sigma-70 family)
MNDQCEANPDHAERETALTLLYDRSRPALRTIANHWIRRCGIGERVAPDDLLGTAMLTVLRNPMQFERLELTEMAAYLSNTLKYQAIRILRKKQAEQRALRTNTVRLRQAMVCSQEADPAATLRWNERLEAIYEQLTGEDRMLGMYRRAGYPWSEIAALMNSSPARLQKRFERAIRRAKGLLEP